MLLSRAFNTIQNFEQSDGKRPQSDKKDLIDAIDELCLPSGWKIQLLRKGRAGGRYQVGQIYRKYISPTGEKFQSRAHAIRVTGVRPENLEA